MSALSITTFEGHASALDTNAIDTLRHQVRGSVLTPADSGYGEARQVWNAMIDRYPALIYQCAGVADVIDAVNFARTHNLLVSVRGGAHSFAGMAVCDGGMVIDLSPMKGIWVDPINRTVRAEPGVKWGEFDRETQAFGLATTGGTVADTGIAGLTLGGGMGWLGGKYGLVSDNLISVDIVTADGQLRRASNTDHPDLFWALRGGGGNFGIVTSFEYQLYPVGTLHAGIVSYSFDQAREVLKFYRDFCRHTPDELSTASAFLTSPDGEPLFGVAVCYNGAIEAGEEVLQPLRSFGSPLADDIGPMSYCQLQSMLDEVVPPRRLYYEKAHFMRDISDEVIDIAVDYFARVPSRSHCHSFSRPAAPCAGDRRAALPIATAMPSTISSSFRPGSTRRRPKPTSNGPATCGRC